MFAIVSMAARAIRIIDFMVDSILQHQVSFLQANKMLNLLSMSGLRTGRGVARRNVEG